MREQIRADNLKRIHAARFRRVTTHESNRWVIIVIATIVAIAGTHFLLPNVH